MNLFDKLKAKGSLTSTPTADWQSPFHTLRQKWTEVPTSRAGRQQTAELLALSDDELKKVWLESREDITTGSQFAHRGWYHALYAPMMKGKKVLDVGSGLAIDPITFAQNGASLTFLDLAPTNLEVVKRMCGLFNLENVSFVWLENLDSLDQLDNDYDIIMAMGSLHHAPQSVIKPEMALLLDHLKIGGRWLQLAYPKARWKREGGKPFSEWGKMTDGEATPWAEWYDLPKLLELMSPAQFDTVLYHEFHNHDFNWFDLIYRGKKP